MLIPSLQVIIHQCWLIQHLHLCAQILLESARRRRSVRHHTAEGGRARGVGRRDQHAELVEALEHGRDVLER